MAYSFTYRREAHFAETDLAGIVHFSYFYRYMEEAEHAFYRSLGFSVHDFRPAPNEAPVGWPRVHASCDFRQPLRFEESFEVELLVEKLRDKTIAYRFRFWKQPGADRELAAEGKVIVVCVRFDGEKGAMQAVSIPESIRTQISPAPAELLNGD